MPELPEVETVKEVLKSKILGKIIKDVKIFHYPIIETPSINDFKKNIIKQEIIDIKRRGKWLMFELNDYFLLSHLRMEGRYYIKDKKEEVDKHEHVCFLLSDNSELRYKDTRKFGRMHLIEKENVYNIKPLSELGLEPWDESLNVSYLKEKYMKIKLPIKTVLLDQSIIVGIGNIYADEILFLCNINPLVSAKSLNDEDLKNIIKYTKKVLESAIKKGGTTIRTYESSEGVHGRFQNELLIHNCEGKECTICHSIIKKIVVNGRGTYYCPKCQK